MLRSRTARVHKTYLPKEVPQSRNIRRNDLIRPSGGSIDSGQREQHVHKRPEVEEVGREDQRGCSTKGRGCRGVPALPDWEMWLQVWTLFHIQ